MARAIDHNLSLSEFPNLDTEGFEKTSDATNRYNCIAWANGDDRIWWWPSFGPIGTSYWPAGIPFSDSVESFMALFSRAGYVECKSPDLESGFEKVAIYADGRFVKHAALQLECGRWTSKLGRNIDITHTLPGLEGPHYGRVVCVMKRSRRPSIASGPFEPQTDLPSSSD